jgi:hypothetical protein
MSIFTRLFSARPKPGALEVFLSELTPATIRSASVNGRDEEMRVATAISLLIFAAVYPFASNLIASTKKLSQIAGSKTVPAVAFDVVVFEAAAFCHHALLEPFLGESHDESEDDQYFAVLQSSVHLSAAVLRRFTHFDLSENFFMNRISSYSLASGRSNPATKFETILSGAIEGGSPKSGLRGPLSLDVGVTLVLKTAIPAFCTHSVRALSVSARQTFENADKLGLVD